MSALRPLHGVMVANATTYERSLAQDVERLLALPTERIRRLWNPQTCDLDDLPYLAWALSVDLWDGDWPDLKKRKVVAEAFSSHALKGTQAALERYIGYVDSQLLRAITPPARGFYTPALTEADRQAFYADLPQVRIYPFLTRRIAPKFRALMRNGAQERAFYGHCFAQGSAGPILYGRRATFYDRGTEVPARYDVLTDPESGLPAERVRILKTGVSRSFYGHGFYGHLFAQGSRAADNVVSVRIDPEAARQFAVFSGDRITSVNPQRIYQGRTAPKGRRFYGRNQGFYLTSFAPNLIFDRVAILDPARLSVKRKVRSFWGHARYGIKPFTAELLVEVPLHRPRTRLGRFMVGYWGKASLKKLQDTLTAVHQAKALSDTILIDTQVHKTVRLNQGLRLGSFKLGELRRIV